MKRGEISWFQNATVATTRQKAPGTETAAGPDSGGRPALPALPQTILQGRTLRPLTPGLFSIAPMIDKTNRHFRWFLRLLTKRVLLYTEMITSAAIVRGKRDLLLDFDPSEHPLALQLGGDDPAEIAEAVRIAEDWGYDEYNLNVGCPSDKVQKGSFGACLMATPDRVADIVSAIAAVTKKPVTVKHRVGITGFGHHQESFEEMVDFVRVVASAGCERFIVHARIAILEGLSPKENRSVPPIRYEDVYRLKALYPELHVELNGQVRSLAEARLHLEKGMDGIMIGRAAYENPLLISELDSFEAEWPNPATTTPVDRKDIAMRYAHYIDSAREAGLGINPRALIWPVLELFPTIRGSRRYKQVLSEAWRGSTPVSERMEKALSCLESEIVANGYN